MLKRVLFGLIVFLWVLPAAFAQETTNSPAAVVTPTRVPRPLPELVVTQGAATLELYFENIPQGRAKLIHVYGENIAGVRARFLDRAVEFYQLEDGYYAFLVAGMEQNARPYEVSVFVTYADGSSDTIVAPVAVITGPFVTQTVVIPPDKAFLVDPEVERSELARMESIFSGFTRERLWGSDGFQLPIFDELTSAFGAFRTVNESVSTRHTGWDIRATLGTPIAASGAGRVAYTGLMSIRGNIVVIDHGYGVYSTYSHLSQVHVTRGQNIAKGQIIGTVGDTGRTSGPHFHWEMAVSGEWVDSTEFVEMWVP